MRAYCIGQGTLFSALWRPQWKGNPKKGDICTGMADSLCCTAETHSFCVTAPIKKKIVSAEINGEIGKKTK